MPTRLIAALALLAVWLAIPTRVHAQTTTTTAAPTTTTTAAPTTTLSTTTTATTTTTSTTTTTTTTTTSTTTTTTLIAAQKITACVVFSDQPLGAGYHVSGHFTGAASYKTGGMLFAIPNTLKAAGRCLCNSPARTPRTVLFDPVNGIHFQYDKTAHTVLAYSAATTQETQTTDLSALEIPFFSVCQ